MFRRAGNPKIRPMVKERGKTSSFWPWITIVLRTIATMLSAMPIIRHITIMETLTKLYARCRFSWTSVAETSLPRITFPEYFSPGVEAKREMDIGTRRLTSAAISAGGISSCSEITGRVACAGFATVAGGAADAEGVAGGSFGSLDDFDLSGVSIRSHKFVS